MKLFLHALHEAFLIFCAFGSNSHSFLELKSPVLQLCVLLLLPLDDKSPIFFCVWSPNCPANWISRYKESFCKHNDLKNNWETIGETQSHIFSWHSRCWCHRHFIGFLIIYIHNVVFFSVNIGFQWESSSWREVLSQGWQHAPFINLSPLRKRTRHYLWVRTC